MNGSIKIFRKASALALFCFILPLTIPLYGAEQPPFPDIKLKDAQMVEMPNFRFILPNSAIELSIHQQVSSTTFDIASKYDILDSFFNIGLDLRFNFLPNFFGIAVGDSINFEQAYGDTTYFQRVRYVTPYYGRNIAKYTEMKAAVSSQDTTTASVDKIANIDKGKNVIDSLGVTYNNRDVLNRAPNGTLLSATVFGAFKYLSGDYDYTKGEIEARTTAGLFLGSYLEPDLKLYFPMTTVLRPISEVYFAGGYDILRGYGYDEFFGDTLEYLRLDYHLPFVKSIWKDRLWTALRIFTLDLTAESAQIGSGIDMGNLNNVKSSVSGGFGANILVLNHVDVKFNAFAGKALEPRSPVFYFILTAYTYFSS
jgi:hypothetical protein